MVLISVLLTLSRFYTLLWCFYYWLWTGKFPLGLRPFQRLFNLTFKGCSQITVTSYFTDFHYSLHYWDNFHPLYHVRTFRWWGFLVRLTCLSFSVISIRPQNAIYYQFTIKQLCNNKCVPQNPTIPSTGIQKQKTNFLPFAVTIFVISKKTH